VRFSGFSALDWEQTEDEDEDEDDEEGKKD
jgi:hypothetical protein